MELVELLRKAFFAGIDANYYSDKVMEEWEKEIEFHEFTKKNCLDYCPPAVKDKDIST